MGTTTMSCKISGRMIKEENTPVVAVFLHKKSSTKNFSVQWYPKLEAIIRRIK